MTVGSLRSAKGRALGATCLLGVACGETLAPPEPGGVSPRQMADALHAVMEADRTVYTRFRRQPVAE